MPVETEPITRPHVPPALRRTAKASRQRERSQRHCRCLLTRHLARAGYSTAEALARDAEFFFCQRTDAHPIHDRPTWAKHRVAAHIPRILRLQPRYGSRNRAFGVPTSRRRGPPPLSTLTSAICAPGYAQARRPSREESHQLKLQLLANAPGSSAGAVHHCAACDQPAGTRAAPVPTQCDHPHSGVDPRGERPLAIANGMVRRLSRPR